jgi:hypothetical protein
MTEDIQILMDTMGTEFTFSTTSMMGLVNYLPETLYNGTYKVEKQDFRFIITTVDCLENSVSIGQIFSFEDQAYIYTFKVVNDPIHDLTGCTELICEYVSKVAA